MEFVSTIGYNLVSIVLFGLACIFRHNKVLSRILVIIGIILGASAIFGSCAESARTGTGVNVFGIVLYIILLVVTLIVLRRSRSSMVSTAGDESVEATSSLKVSPETQKSNHTVEQFNSSVSSAVKGSEPSLETNVSRVVPERTLYISDPLRTPYKGDLSDPEIVFSDRAFYVQGDLPVALSDVQILKDKSGSMYASFAITPSTSLSINALIVAVECFSVWGEQLNGEINYQILDLYTEKFKIKRQVALLPLQDSGTRKVTIKIRKIAFEDGSVLENNNCFVKIDNDYESFLRQKEYEEKTLKEKEERENRARIEKEKQEKEARRIVAEAEAKIANKRKKSLIIIIGLVLVIFGFLVYCIQYRIPKDKYDKAVNLIEKREYEKAEEIFESLGNYRDSDTKINQIKLVTAKERDTVILGNYEQDGNTKNGKEEIEWVVLKKENDRILVISKYIIDNQPFNDKSEVSNWDSCSLREWLNNDFKKDAFNNIEEKRIIEYLVKADENPDYDVFTGKDEKSKVFLLSIKEAKEYSSSNKLNLNAQPTKAANRAGFSGRWWLRTTGSSGEKTAGVDYGKIDSSGFKQEIKYFGVRPAMWIDISDIND